MTMNNRAWRILMEWSHAIRSSSPLAAAEDAYKVAGKRLAQLLGLCCRVHLVGLYRSANFNGEVPRLCPCILGNWLCEGSLGRLRSNTAPYFFAAPEIYFSAALSGKWAFNNWLFEAVRIMLSKYWNKACKCFVFWHFQPFVGWL